MNRRKEGEKKNDRRKDGRKIFNDGRNIGRMNGEKYARNDERIVGKVKGWKQE